MLIKGDTPEAPCFNSPEETDHRTPSHVWRALQHKSLIVEIVAHDLKVEIQCCDACGAMRKIGKQESCQPTNL